jgi:alanine racemase
MSDQGHLPSLSRVLLDLNALDSNLSVVNMLSAGKKVIAVVKADAYGHGAVEISRHLEGRIHSFAVAQPSEGIQLRKLGIQSPILVLCMPEPHFAHLYAEWNLDATVGHFDALSILPVGTRVHIKFDTGMRRLGFLPHGATSVLKAVQARPDLEVVGLMSHFANADVPGHPSVQSQLDAFQAISKQFPKTWMRHLSNSAATLSLTDLPVDAVRVGLLLYGYAPNGMDAPSLSPVKRWMSRITQVRPIGAGTPVSYGWTWHAPADGWIGVVPVGYADGYPRLASSRAFVDLTDGPAHVAGRVTMDYIMVYTHHRPLHTGEEVTLLGGPNCTADMLAQASDTISYDILCQTGRRRQGL